MNIVDKNQSKDTYDKYKKMKENRKMEINDSMLNILKKNNQIIFDCPENSGLKIFSIKKGEIQKIGTNLNNNNNEGKTVYISKV